MMRIDALLFDALLHKYHIDQAKLEYLPAYFNGKIYTASEVFLNHIFPIKKTWKIYLNHH